jgi:hypothetical protein
MIDMLSSGWLPARWAVALCFSTGFFDDLGFGQVFYPLKYRVRLILARTVLWFWFGSCSGSFHLASLLHNTLCQHVFVGSHATVSLKVRFFRFYPDVLSQIGLISELRSAGSITDYFHRTRDSAHGLCPSNAHPERYM